MFKKKNRWLQFGCFLIGYNYSLLSSCSEASKKAVRKYTSALLIVMILWALIGYLFSKEYIRIQPLYCVGISIVLTIIIIQIERQIILGSKNIVLSIFRFILGIIMALLGAIIIDQMIFKEDILKEKNFSTSEELAALLPKKIAEVKHQIYDLDSLIIKKETEREAIIEAITKKPNIPLPSSKTVKVETTHMVNGVEKDSVYFKRIYSTASIPNPKYKLIPNVDTQIATLREQKNGLSAQIIDIKQKTEKDLLLRKGFLDELKLMHKIISSSSISLFVWSLWLLFFLLIESLVLFAKFFSTENDYDSIVKHQMEVRIKAINKLSNSN